MRAPVRARWLDFTEPFEGGVASLYNDVRGMTTIAYGNLVNSVAAVIGLPFVWPDGRRATTAEIAAAWQSVHNDPQAAIRGWTYAARLTPLRLTLEGMQALAYSRLDANDRILRARLPDCWDDLPACAQLALHSLAWACGPHAHYPRLFQAVADGAYEEAAVQIHMNEWTPEGVHNKGLIPRNVANKILMRNAARVRDFHLDPDLLEWKTLIGVSDLPTQPALPAEQPIVHVDPVMYRLDEEPEE